MSWEVRPVTPLRSSGKCVLRGFRAEGLGFRVEGLGFREFEQHQNLHMPSLQRRGWIHPWTFRCCS